MAPVASQLIRTLEITNLPSLPHVLLRVLDMCNRDDISLRAIADIIGKDTALSSKVIGASNSARFGRPNNLGSLEQMLALLGLDMVQTIAISSSVYQVFNNLGGSSEFNLKSFWGRSLTTAFHAKLIAQSVSYPHPEEAYLTGLLLDIGKLVLWRNFPNLYVSFSAEHPDEVALLERESAEFGNNHCEVGSWLVRNWNLSSFMADAVLYHHLPEHQIAGTHPLIQIAQVANHLCMDEDDQDEQCDAANRLLGIAPETLLAIQEKTRILVAEVAKSLGIEVESPVSPTADAGTQKKSWQDNLRQKKKQLAAEVRDIALIDRNLLGVASTTSMEKILSTIQCSVQILLGIQDVVFFMPDTQGKILKGMCPAGQDLLLSEISIPLNQGNSLVTDAYLNRMPASSFLQREERISSIIDEQIVRLIRTEGIFCLPLTTRESVVGVMIFGLSQSQFDLLSKQQKLVSMLARQSAHAISALNAFNDQEVRIKQEVMESTRSRTRKIVHEANNPLSIIRNYIKLLSVKLPKEDPAQDDLKIIKEEIDRVTRIFRVVSVASESETRVREKVNANELIQNLCKVFFKVLFAQYRINIQTELDPALASIETDRDKLTQIIVNLMKNAAEAMQSGGNLKIATRGNVKHNEREYIEISVEDNGPGIPAEVMNSLFRPVTSSKGAGHAGLGLSIVKGLVDELDGRILCESTETSGTTFQIQLPMHGDTA